LERGVQDLREAAENGSLEGQYRYGSVVFGFAYTDHAPEARDEARYVSAFTFLRIAAVRGHARVLESLPGLQGPSAAALTGEPFDAIPKPWLERAFRDADAWLGCAPAEAKSRYEAPPKPPPTVLDKSSSGWVKRGDPEGPLLRAVAATDGGPPLTPPATTQLLALLPGLYDCYAAWLSRLEGATTTLSFDVDLANAKLIVSGAGDPELRSCAREAAASVALPADDKRFAHLEVSLFPRALSAPELPEMRDADPLERWDADGSCWQTFTPPCAPKKECLPPSRIRVRCPVEGE